MLGKKTKRFLKVLYRDGEISIKDANVLTGFPENKRNLITSTLQSIGYIEYVQSPDVQDETGNFVEGDAHFQITIAGRAFLEQQKRDVLMFWIPYTITTLIAVGSLVISILALLGSNSPISCG